LIKIALALEGELFALEKEQDKFKPETMEAYDLLARIFEYAARILSQKGGESSEYWLRAAVAFSLAERSANSAVSARRYAATGLGQKDYVDRVKTITSLFLSRNTREVRDQANQVIEQLSRSTFNVERSESVQDRLRQSGCLNFLEALTKVTSFLVDGDPNSLEGWQDFLKRSGRLLHESGDPLLEWIASRLERVCSNLLSNSLWAYRTLLPNDYIRALTHHPTHPIVELWTSQIEAAGQTLSPNAHTHQTIVMPTSAGKTLVAQMMIVRELYGSAGNAFYVATTRALVNEITESLTRYLPKLGIEVSRIPGDYEFVPSLDDLFETSPRVYVLTPEKLDLLWRINDSRLSAAKVFVFDEAQTIREGGRGLRLELLISKIRSNFGHQARILLLSAVISRSNISEFTEWLGRDDADGVKIDWKPTRNLEAYFYREMTDDWRGTLHYFGRFNIDNVLPPQRNAKNRENAVRLAWKYQMFLGPVLVYCSSRNEAEQVAIALHELARRGGPSSNKALKDAATKVESMLGKNFPLANVLQYGIAYHHASLPDPVRHLIERLARNGSLNVLTCTSTLAEGVNLNVGTVIISSPFAGSEPMDGSRLRNLAGRAGRALQDTEGHVIVLHDSLQRMLKDEDSSKIFSRFFEYMRKIRERPGFNNEIDVVEAELLARVYRKQLSSADLPNQMQEFLRATFFSKQSTSQELGEVTSRITNQAQVILNGRPRTDAQLKIFASTGLNFEFCQKLDSAAIDLASKGNLNVRKDSHLNWPLLERVFSECMLDSERLEAAAKKKLKDPVSLVKGWVSGRSFLDLAAMVEASPTTRNLTMLSNYLYGYVTEDVSWASAALVRLLASHTSSTLEPSLPDPEWELVPTYVRLGVSTPGAFLLMASGLDDRDLANKLSKYDANFKGDNESWIREINWIFSLDPTIDNSVARVQEGLLNRLGPFVLPVDLYSELTGSVEIDASGRIWLDGKEAGKVNSRFQPLVQAIRQRGFTAILRGGLRGKPYVEIAPRIFRD
jgi:superfamily II DNA/RNA helicase